MKYISIQRFPKGHPLYSDAWIENKDPHKGVIGKFQANFGQCVDNTTGEIISYTMERRDTLIEEGRYDFDLYFSPANHCKVPRLTVGPHGQNISNREFENHIANWPFELKGCTAHGLSVDVSVPMLVSSGKAFNKLMNFLNGEVGTITYETLK